MQIELFEPSPEQVCLALGGMPRSVHARYELAGHPETLAKVLASIPTDEFVTWGHIRSNLEITLGLALTQSLMLLKARGDIEEQTRYFGSPSPLFDNYLGFEVLYRKIRPDYENSQTQAKARPRPVMAPHKNHGHERRYTNGRQRSA